MKKQKEISIADQCEAVAREIVSDLCHFEDEIDAIRAAKRIEEKIVAIAKDAYVKGGDSIHKLYKT